MTGDAMNTYPGGMQVDKTDPNLFYIIDNSESEDTQIVKVRVLRDECGHVTGWDGDATTYAVVPYADANLLHAPNDTFLFTEWPENHISQLMAVDPIALILRTYMMGDKPSEPDLGDSSNGTAGLAWVPLGYATSGQLRTMTWGGDFYGVPFTTDEQTGALTIGEADYLVSLPNGPGGMTYIPIGSPVLDTRKLGVLEYSADKVVFYATDSDGTPDVEERIVMLDGADGAWGGGFTDPISGDMYWSAWGGDEQIHVISGFALPECGSDANCHETQYCSATTSHCVSKAANGAAVPTDPGHFGATLDGTCTGPAAAAGCLSGTCDAVDNLCGQRNAAACTGTEQCRTGTCLGNVCSGGECATDTDCPTTYCESGLTCALEKLANGAPLPENHGECGGYGSQGAATTTCASGECNFDAGTCAGENGIDCSENTECINNICGSNGKCGAANGDGACNGELANYICQSGICHEADELCGHPNAIGPCSVETAEEVCRSAACSPNGDVCIPAGEGRCWVDEDCSETEYCNRADFQCTLKELAGIALPQDGLHGACDVDNGNAACASGLCNPTALTCGEVGGVACDANDDCQSNVCFLDVCSAPPSCDDAVKNADETDVDCGGSTCGGCPTGSVCSVDADCLSNICNETDVCEAAPSCDDAVRNADETDVDCGGSTCGACLSGNTCTVDADCLSNLCGDNDTCDVAPGCDDGAKNASETDIDCGGGTCNPCALGNACLSSTDCASAYCDAYVCGTAPACDDATMNGDESDVDCGGSCADCVDGKTCTADPDCVSSRCESNVCEAVPATCNDATMNGDESDVDCGGSCAACDSGKECNQDDDCVTVNCDDNVCTAVPPSCDDVTMNGDESDVDCGGSCAACEDNKACNVDDDCASSNCDEAVCTAVPPTCNDGIENGDESDIDCGGACASCKNGDICIADADCTSNNCDDGVCELAPPRCDDGIENGEESDVDCGGSCDKCRNGEACEVNGDCASSNCDDNECRSVPATCDDGKKNGKEKGVDCGGPCQSCDPTANLGFSGGGGSCSVTWAKPNKKPTGYLALLVAGVAVTALRRRKQG
jgi:hypothetical protein